MNSVELKVVFDELPVDEPSSDNVRLFPRWTMIQFTEVIKLLN